MGCHLGKGPDARTIHPKGNSVQTATSSDHTTNSQQGSSQARTLSLVNPEKAAASSAPKNQENVTTTPKKGRLNKLQKSSPLQSSGKQYKSSSDKKSSLRSSPQKRSAKKQEEGSAVSIKLKTITEAQGESTVHGSSSIGGPTDRLLAAVINDQSKTEHQAVMLTAVKPEDTTNKSGNNFFLNQNFENELKRQMVQQQQQQQRVRKNVQQDKASLMEEERKGFAAEDQDLKVERSSLNNLPPIVHPVDKTGQFEKSPAFMTGESSQTSQVDENTVVEELGDSTVDQIKVLTDAEMLEQQKLEVTLNALDLQKIQVGSSSLMQDPVKNSRSKAMKDSRQWDDSYGLTERGGAIKGSLCGNQMPQDVRKSQRQKFSSHQEEIQRMTSQGAQRTVIDDCEDSDAQTVRGSQFSLAESAANALINKKGGREVLDDSSSVLTQTADNIPDLHIEQSNENIIVEDML